MDDILGDKRFAHVAKDPRFRRIPAGERKVKIDGRFKGMFKDKRFKLKYSVDKRGKPMNLTTNENLKKYYELSDQDSSDSDDDEDDENESDSEVTESKFVVPEKSGKDLDKIKVKTSDKSDRKAKAGKQRKESVSLDDSDGSDLDGKTDNILPDKKGKKNKDSGASDPRFQKDLLKMSKVKNADAVRQKKATETGKDRVEEDTDDKSDDVDAPGDQFDSEEDSDDEQDSKPVGNDSGVDFARGEGNIESSSSDEDDDEEDDSDDQSDDNDVEDESKFDHKWGEADENIVSIEDATCRLAVCNMDWDRVKAKDIFVLLNSFKPADGVIKSVKIYPSEYGKERMAEEAAHGPRELKEMKLDSDEDDDDENIVNEEGTTYHREKLRQYQLNRLKYYYAVVECDRVETADHIYKECDGMEYETSATKLDLRFIPEEETFSEDDVSSVCREIPGNYKPQFFFNAALAQSKVDFTWDETDRDRVQLASQQFSQTGEEAAEEDLKAYLASSSDEEGPDYGALLGNAEQEGDESEEDSDEDRKIDKYKQLLTDIDVQEHKKKLDVQMEISWEPGLRETTETLVKKKKQSKNSTVWEDYLQRKKEKKKQMFEERKKKKESMDHMSDDGQDDNDDQPEGGEQAFSDDELPVDADMAAFMAEANSEDKKKKKNKKKKKKKGIDEEDSKEKAELSLLMMDGEDKKHFNLQDLMQDDGKKKKKKKKQKEVKNKANEDFSMDVSDPRFSAVYESHLFNIDPSAPEYRKTKGTEAMISEKIKRSGKRDRSRMSEKDKLLKREEGQVKKTKLMDSEATNSDSLASLVKSVKSKTKHFHSNKSMKR